MISMPSLQDGPASTSHKAAPLSPYHQASQINQAWKFTPHLFGTSFL